jgi:Mce-associated membrane protein
VVLGYDHATLDEDFAAALELTTGEFREEYRRTSEDVVRQVATDTAAVVEAEVVSAGVVSAAPDEVVVLLFVNQTTTSNRLDGPRTDQNRVRMTMTREGDTWKVSAVDAF